MSISIVIPTYNEGENISVIHNHLEQVFCCEDKEIIFVNDGSTDKETLLEFESVAKNIDVIVINLEQNIGQQKAILEGIKHCTKDVIGIMDCDMQDSPSDMLRLYKMLEEKDADVVIGKRINPPTFTFRYMMSGIYNKIICKILNREYVIMSEFSCFRNGIEIKDEYIRGELIKKEKVAFYPYIRNKRMVGKSKYSIFDLIKTALKGIKYTLKQRKEINNL